MRPVGRSPLPTVRHIGSLSWLIHSIDDPVMRDMSVAPSNRLRRLEGSVSMPSGDVHRNPRPRVPVLAFKACHDGLRVARRFGWRPGDAGMVRVAASAAVAAGAEADGGTASATAR